ncbi:erythromycin esterase family protein [Clostridium sp. Marseille-Q2269]|uniref:erythromycin esterase family protein n=1 Tax=Clostridium sp. Marseille-Q2269 TaxID=2942205 RepID=UPI00207498CD|nr:erythromycin esterase family protein [Clostridium sp. Marseille-Q2269]
MISREKRVNKIKLNLDEFGNDYYAIGTDFNKSTFSAVTSKDKDKNFSIINSNSLVYEFLSLPGNIYFMDFKKAKSDSDLKKIVEEKQAMGSVGAKFNSWQKILKRFYTLNMVPSKAYDGIIVVKTATPTEILEN